MFLCFRIPTGTRGEGDEAETVWDVRWYLHDPASGETTEALEAVHDGIVCGEGTARQVTMPKVERTRVRKAVETAEVNRVLFMSQLPVEMKPELVCWMEVG
jgi:hypothetical protein